ncbi:MAG: tRNA glutamyl-Q(34) synthetase GluQRS [Candidatus Thiodiazotropha sp. (ex Dulcina madagascariensis)]|nr:tRNA glutamyl-Q(34) synthetase GluQRS [Candidatus Thiodiazotropha sp. (ex Dulcina madagascariensis)]
MTKFVTNPPYRGRFAPSPTGSLHFGSLVAALGSYLDARHRGGEWLVRMEDLDRTREVEGSAALILRTLEGFGFHWDGEALYQSRRTEAYAVALEAMTRAGLSYPCGCSRREIIEKADTGSEGPIYPGTCRKGLADDGTTHSIRILTDDRVIEIRDAIQGPVRQNLAREIGDFVIRRADGFHAYQLAVVVDDAWQEITHVVRGADLLSSTPRQCYLQQCLGLPRPDYAHLPLAVDDQGRKLSKQHQDAPVDPERPLEALLQALAFLNQPLPPERPASLDEFWRWSIAHWSLATIPVKTELSVNDSPSTNSFL